MRDLMVVMVVAGVVASCGFNPNSGVVVDGMPPADGGTCIDPSDCVDDPATPCAITTCVDHTCVDQPVAANTPLQAQAEGDCQTAVCNGLGAVGSLPDDLDVPDDNLECTLDQCSDGAPSNAPVVQGTDCGDNGDLECNDAGACVGCNAPADCGNGGDDECKTTTCSEAGVCGVAFAPDATPADDQTVGDCIHRECDGLGNIADRFAATDVNVDAKACTADVCDAAAGASNPPVAAGTTCNEDNGERCNATGMCVAECADSVQDGDETDVDCGGSCTANCAVGDSCEVNGDCTSALCRDNGCVASINGCTAASFVDLTAFNSVTIAFGGVLGQNYVPRCIKVKLNASINWIGSFTTHPLVGGAVIDGVASPDVTSQVPLTSTGSSVVATMSTAGDAPYYCSAHALNGMTGAIIVMP